MNYAWKGSFKIEGSEDGEVAGVEEALGDAPALKDHREDPSSRIKIKYVFQEISKTNKPTLSPVSEFLVLGFQFSDIRTDNNLIVSVFQ